MALKKVVLPAPLGPMTAEIWLAGMPIDASSSATTPPKRTVSDLASSARPSVKALSRRRSRSLAFLSGHWRGRDVALTRSRRGLRRRRLLGLLLLDLLLPVLIAHSASPHMRSGSRESSDSRRITL